VKGPPRTARQIAVGRRRRCMHCHNVKESLNQQLRRANRWERDMAWRYPLPDNLGLTLEVDRGNVVQRIAAGSAAAKMGLRPGDVVRKLNGVPVHSIADAQFALDRAPVKGSIAIAWERAGKPVSATIPLAEGWRRSDLSWRASMLRFIPSLPLSGTDLTEVEKKALGLPAGKLAFRQKASVHSRAQAAGVRAGDVICGIDDRTFQGIDAEGLRDLVRQQYLVGDRIKIHVLREGKRLELMLTLR
jgi:S1-C subfamily serine protease